VKEIRTGCLLEARGLCASRTSPISGRCARLAYDRGERECVARGGRDYFDRFLDRRQLAAYYVYEIAAWE
jgi:hypothetical protein